MKLFRLRLCNFQFFKKILSIFTLSTNGFTYLQCTINYISLTLVSNIIVNEKLTFHQQLLHFFFLHFIYQVALVRGQRRKLSIFESSCPPVYNTRKASHYSFTCRTSSRVAVNTNFYCLLV